MLGLSIGKLLVILGVIAALWQGIKILTRMRAAVDAKNRIDAQRRATQRPAAPPAGATDLVECPRCGTFVPNGTFCPSKEQCRLRPAV